MQVLRHQGYRRMAWKNGGGETAEIAIFPEGATLEAFDWRVSTAIVGTDGPFSAFPGVDRTLSILRGNGLTLVPEARGPVRIGTTSLPLAFPAEIPMMAHLSDGPVTDFNVMTRRSRFRHYVSRMNPSEPSLLARHGASMLVFLADGEAEVAGDAGVFHVLCGDTVVLDEADGKGITLSPLGQVTAYVVDLWPV